MSCLRFARHTPRSGIHSVRNWLQREVERGAEWDFLTAIPSYASAIDPRVYVSNW
jgi:hypothetical protein